MNKKDKISKVVRKILSRNSNRIKPMDKLDPYMNYYVKHNIRIVKKIEDNFKICYFALLMHFALYRPNFNRCCRMTLIFVMLSLTCDAFFIYSTFRTAWVLYYYEQNFLKMKCFFLIFNIVGVTVRLSMCKNMNDYVVIGEKVAHIYHIISPKNALNFRHKIVLLTFINIIWAICSTIFHICFILDHSTLRDWYAKHLLYHVENDMMILMGISTFIFVRYWTIIAVPFLICIYFYCICYILKECLTELENYIVKSPVFDYKRIFFIHNEITGILLKISKLLEVALHLIAALIIFMAFFSFYAFSFTSSKNKYIELFYLSLFFWGISGLLLICFASSSLHRVSEEIKRTMYRLLTKPTLQKIAFVLKIQDNSFGFTLMDSIKIDKKLLLTVLCSFVTYGIIVATWSEINMKLSITF